MRGLLLPPLLTVAAAEDTDLYRAVQVRSLFDHEVGIFCPKQLRQLNPREGHQLTLSHTAGRRAQLLGAGWAVDLPPRLSGAQRLQPSD